jgi:hypothetical protein
MRTSFFAALFLAAGFSGANAQALIVDDDYFVGRPGVVVEAAPVVRPGFVVVRRAPVMVERPPVVVAPAPVVIAPRVCSYGYYC